ncbi:MAG: SH3 domain-containing protein [Deltaproteobacteria bacterium]|nr:SH3 domain-containing protein [Deltaproteobacteria bacterium]
MFRSAIHAMHARLTPRAQVPRRTHSLRRALANFSVGAIAAVGIALALASPASAQQGQPAYVDTTALNLRVDAGTKSTIVGILLKYDAVTVLGRKRVGSSTWYEIEASGGYTNGYVSARFIQFGETPAGATAEGPLDYGARETPTLVRGEFKYVGPGTCAECHDDSTGNFPDGASSVWRHTVHSSAYQTLSKDYTIEIAKRKRGIDKPVNDWRCVKCHVTAFGADPSQLGPGYAKENGVSCEVCHGPGSAYADAEHGPDNPNRRALGFRILNDLTERREVCTSCHNTTSPTYKPFNLREFSRSIAHWVDPGDKFYYKDAVTEATKRQERVEAKRDEQAAVLVAENAAANEAQVQREAEAAQKLEQERKQREAAAAKANATERARLQKEQAEADAQAADKAADKAKRDEAARADARKRLEAEEKQAKQAERKAAEAALVAEAAEEAEKDRAASAARKKAEEQARASAKSATGVESYLEDVDDVITLNTDGEKYLSVKFPHLAHASKQYLPNGSCNDCHHTQEGDEAPEACITCHEIGGDADEDKKKKRAVHTKNKGFPRQGDQEETSCVGCHKSMNSLLEASKREGDPAPTKCTVCHKRNR